MATKSRSPHGTDSGQQERKEAPQIDLQSGSWSTVREEYNKKYPLFGSQIHFAIDVIRQVIKDARRKLAAAAKMD